MLEQFSDNRFVSELDNVLEDARQHKEWRHKYMTLQMKMQEQYQKGKEDGEKIGREQGEEKHANLMKALLAYGRLEDMQKALEDLEFLQMLYKEYQI